MTQKELAKASGMSLPQIARYERGESVPRMTALVKLAKALEVDVEDLQSKEEPETVDFRYSIAGGPDQSLPIPHEIYLEVKEYADKVGHDPLALDIALMSIGVWQRAGYELTKEQVIEAYDIAIATAERARKEK
ncbi:TPA: helix-turn-helix transcriptional regulator [Pseudomonas aeruginosa]|nr:helix-turn-helix transcriptional regulator [Pseudomonas aeruginosa]HBP2507883.1 helix-turn-helix transcriptional regulator [Pseudomonas aeruginosa]HBP2589348.1 helix-turn-helix transcriptional regulator [Pseudomonas aeruginosa]HBP2724999.1 helix-turn-helix transcriptional regulator [Pseudomonas aeruginosa]HBP2731769.1 helix-turn-helix transcriptional regulator [Pseudomonas aeruginosa]